jgi:hypothetical protein
MCAKCTEWAEFVHIMACFDFLQGVALVQGYAIGGLMIFVLLSLLASSLGSMHTEFSSDSR